MKIAITGSTGQLGRLVIANLKTKTAAENIIALARTPSKAVDLGVSVREADYAKPDTLVAALHGIDALLLISGNELGQRAAQHANVLSAAKKANVGRVVYTSLLRANTSPLNIAAEHYQTETDLVQSGIPYTILRNGWYIENYMGSLKGAIAAGAFLGSAGNGKISGAARVDYAEAAVRVLTSDGHGGKTYELAGDTAFTLSELAAELSRQVGRTIPYRDLPEAEYAAALLGFGLPDVFANGIASWDVAAASGALFDDGKQLSKLIGRHTTPLSDVIAQTLKA